MRKQWIVWSQVLAAMLLIVACAQTDAGITAKVKAKFAADDTVKAYQIDVTTNNKVVTLTGNVDSDAAKTQAVALTRNTEGVTDVVDNLAIAAPTTGSAREQIEAQGRAAGQAAGDASITTVLKGKLIADPMVGGLRIDVDTNAGIVTLSGTVKTEAERAEALRLARETAGVKDVIDKLVLRP